MSKTNNTHGGSRPGAGRPRKGDLPRVTISFSVDVSTLEKAQKLRAVGYPLGLFIEKRINEMYEDEYEVFANLK